MIIKMDSTPEVAWPSQQAVAHTSLCLVVDLVNAAHDYIRVLVITSHSWLILSFQSTNPPRSFLQELLSSWVHPPSSTYAIDFILT